MTDQESEKPSDEIEQGSSLPHTPPLGIRAVRPGQTPPIDSSEVPHQKFYRNRPTGNWFAALVATGGVVFSIIGTFLPWSTQKSAGITVQLIGWDQAAMAVVILVLGLIGAGVTGALWAGERGMVLKVVLLLTGAILFTVSGFEIADISPSDVTVEAKISVGIGLPIVLVGGGLLMIAALLDRSPWRFKLSGVYNRETN